MKVRSGFVSNSSSSSFVCAICDRSEGGWDADWSDFDMDHCYECGNCFCIDHMKKFTVQDKQEILLNDEEFMENADEVDKSAITKGIGSDIEDLWETFLADLYDGCPSSMCPICSLTYIPDRYILTYMIYGKGKTKENITDEIRNKFVDLKDLKRFYNES